MNQVGALTPPQSRHLFLKLRHFTDCKNIRGGKSLHAHFLKSGEVPGSSIFTIALLNLYAKCSLFSESRLLFAEIPQHHKNDAVPWSILINTYSQLGHSHSALHLFKQMLHRGTLPNSHTFAGVFSAAAVSVQPLVAHQAHCWVIKLVHSYDVFVYSSLLNAYCKMGFLDDGRRVFDEMPERNSITWSTMVSGYASKRVVNEVIGIFKMMVVCGGEEDANEFVFTSVLSAFTEAEFVGLGKQIHCLAIKNGLVEIVSVGNAIVTMYSKCRSLDEAVRAFESCDDKNSITWSALITGCAQNGYGEKALVLFEQMHSCGMKPSEYTFVGVLNACSDGDALKVGTQVHGQLVKLGFESQMYIMTALVDMYAKCGSFNDAQKGFDSLKEPDLVLWTSMIGGFVQNGDSEGAFNLYCKMQTEGIPPNELTMASVLKACSSLSALEQGKQIHAHAVKNGFNLEVPIGSALSTMYAKCGNLDDGNSVFRRMPARDVVSWNAMISGLSQNGLGVEALDLFEEMQLEGAKPDYVTFVNILSACSHMGLVDRGREYFKSMSDKFGIMPRVEHYACMVDILGRAGKLQEAKEFIESATIDHGLSLWRILLSACRNHRNYELGAYAGEKLIELGSQESSAYVLLSSIYSALQRLDDVERVRRIMSIRGVNKEPGCSWIELKSKVHVFVVGDMLHPEIKDIRGELWRFTMVMKDEGCQLESGSVIDEYG